MLENNILKKNILKNFKTSDKNAVYAIGSKVNLNDKSLEYNKLVDDLLNNDIVLKMKNLHSTWKYYLLSTLYKCFILQL